MRSVGAAKNVPSLCWGCVFCGAVADGNLMCSSAVGWAGLVLGVVPIAALNGSRCGAWRRGALPTAVFTAGLVLPLFVACRHSPDPREAAQVVRLVEQLRDADNKEKRPHLDALRATPCSRSLVCELKDTCVRGYDQHLDTYDELQRAKQKAAAGEPVPPLDELRERLRAARPVIQQCTVIEAAVRHEYDL